jgi:Transglycosylase-like domain
MKKTKTALALAGTALAVPSAALAAAPADDALHPSGKLTHDPRLKHRLVREHHRRASTASPVLEAIAACESGGNPATDTGNGFYGKYQFTQATWQAVGGTGNPAAAPEAEQDRRAAQLYAQAGPSQWPVCGR